MRNRACPLVLISAVAVAVTVPAIAQAAAGSRQTREFVQAAEQSDQFEILEATTALAQSQDTEVRDFARQMIEAHQRSSAQIRQVATGAGLEPPLPGISGDQSMFLAALQSARGADFDTIYIRQQILAHRAALAVERDYAQAGDDAAVRGVASGMVSVISSHLDMAERIMAKRAGT
jgi:putative membrane protein